MTTPYQSQELWKALSALPDRVWQDTLGGRGDPPPWREIAQLLCSAAWHFELAEKIQTPFSSQTMAALLGPKPPWPWAHWLQRHQAFGNPPPTGHPWVMPIFADPMPGQLIDCRALTFMQSALLGDVALRLAGIWEILRNGKYPSGRKPQKNWLARICSLFQRKRALPPRNTPKTWAASIKDPMIDKTLNKILTRKGEIQNPKKVLPIMKHLLVVLALRDSFMHGEISDSEDRRRRYRDRFIGSNEYTPQHIADACVAVWKGLLDILKQHA